MVIVSQDKKVVTNFSDTVGIQIEEHILNSDGERDYELKALTEKRTCNIGIYVTEERAKEVLEEITETYIRTEQYKVEDEMTQMRLFTKGIFMYEMPKK